MNQNANVDRELDEREESVLMAEAKLRSNLYKQASLLAKKHGYSSLTGLEALCRYFADKYHWTPQQTRELTTDDIRLLLERDA